MRLSKHIKFGVMPLLRSEDPALTIRIRDRVLGAQEVRHAVAMFPLQARDGKDLVHGGLEPEAGQEAERVADVDDGVRGPARDEAPLVALGRQDLQPPLLGEEHGEAPEVGVLVVPDALAERVLLGIAEHGHGGEGGLAVAVEITEVRGAFELQGCGEGVKDDRGDIVGGSDETVK